MLKMNNQILKTKKEKEVSSLASARPHGPISYFLKEPFDLTRSKAQALMKIAESEDRLMEVADWWYKYYYSRGKPGDPFALIYKALKEDWDIKEDPYYGWGHGQL